MRFSYYETSPQRFNPEFIGIAGKYAQHKKKRLTIEKKRKQLDSGYQYTLNLDTYLNKSLENKAIELNKLQKARERHLQQMKRKQELEQQKRIELEHLRDKNNRKRKVLKDNLEKAKNNTISRNKQVKEKLLTDLSRLNQKFDMAMKEKQEKRWQMYQTIKQEEINCLRNIDEFYRCKNNESLQHYIDRIRKENMKKKQDNKKIKQYEKYIRQMNKTVEVKKNYLEEIQQQIYQYRTDLKTVEASSRLKKSKRHTQGIESSEDNLSPNRKQHNRFQID